MIKAGAVDAVDRSEELTQVCKVLIYITEPLGTLLRSWLLIPGGKFSGVFND